MPVLLKDYRCNNFSGRRTVYSKFKSITTRGFDTSNDLFAGGNFGILQGLNDNSKDYFSLECNDIIKFNNLYVACGANSSTDNRTRLSTFLYSDNGGVSWTFSNDTFESGDYGLVLIVSKDNNNINTLFCGGSGTDSNGNLYGLMSSTDGINWETVTPITFSKIDDMATNGSQEIVAVGWNTEYTNRILQYSTDSGGNWTSVSNISINPGDIVKIVYANDRFYVGVADYNNGSTLTVYTSTSSNLTNWTPVTFNDSTNASITSLSAYLSGVYYSSVNNSDLYILYLGSYRSSVTGVFYSSDGVTFTASTGITFSNASVTNVTYNDTDNDSNFYLSVHYYNSPISPDTPIMYNSSNGESWTGIITSNKLSSGLPSSISSSTVTGISQFFIQDSAIVACGSYGDASAFGLVSIALPHYTVTSYGTSIALNGGVTKLFHDDAILVGVYEYSISDNTIYYFDGTQLVATEHQEDV